MYTTADHCLSLYTPDGNSELEMPSQYDEDVSQWFIPTT